MNSTKLRNKLKSNSRERNKDKSLNREGRSETIVLPEVNPYYSNNLMRYKPIRVSSEFKNTPFSNPTSPRERNKKKIENIIKSCFINTMNTKDVLKIHSKER